MAKRKKKRGKRGMSGLSGTPAKTTKTSKGEDRKKITCTLLSFAGGTLMGAVLDKPSGPLGILAGAYGIWKKNPYIASAGLGMLLGNAGKSSGNADVTNVKEYIKSAPERAKGFVKALGEKLFISSGTSSNSDAAANTDQGTSGLNENEKVTYFINPYTRKTDSLDMSALDRVHEQVNEMNGMGALDPTDRNF